MSQRTRDTCVCGHVGDAHEHYRSGSDCSLCPPGSCSRFRRAGGLVRRLLSAAGQGRPIPR
jgi:hypothetical protein